MTTTSLFPAEFTLEGMNDQWLAGFTEYKTWNGWACPYFTLAQAKEVAKALGYGSDDDFSVVFFEERNMFIVSVNHEVVDYYEAVLVPGHDEWMYPIGARGWCWAERNRSA